METRDFDGGLFALVDNADASSRYNYGRRITHPDALSVMPVSPNT